LLTCAKNGSVVALENLLKTGTDVNYCDLSRDTALHWAASYDRVDCINKLCEYRAMIDCTDIDGDTPLNCAGRALLKIANSCQHTLEKLPAWKRSTNMAQQLTRRITTAGQHSPSQYHDNTFKVICRTFQN
jgi:hypothetical protein